MTHWIKTLVAETEAYCRGQAQETSRRHSDDAAAAARDRMTPLSVRLSRLLATIPADVQRAGLSLPSLSTMLRGRQGRCCSAGELGTALRGLGWTRDRRWRGGEGGGFSALWRPPGSA